MQLFYNPSLDKNTREFLFSTEESKHITRVLRKKEDDLLKITNGYGEVFTAKILEANIKRCKALIIDSEKTIPSPYTLHLAVAPTKMNDRFEWFLEKATEIGVHEITPLLCERSERKIPKPERWQKVLQAAMKQSLQTYLPQLHPITSFKDFVNTTTSELKYVAHCGKGEKAELKQKIQTDKSVLILIGPEGDFSQKEIDLALASDFVPVSLGKNRLRTETAAIVACATVAMINR